MSRVLSHRRFSLRGGLAAVAVLALSCSSQGGGGVTQFENTRFIQGAVQGGSADYADTGVVGVYLMQNGYPVGSCTGTLIAPNLVLTARHCVASTPQQPVCGTSKFGSTHPASTFLVFNDQTVSNNTTGYKVKQVLVDPTGNGVCGHDVALLILQGNISSSVAKTIEPRVFEQPHINETYAAVGYGNTCATCHDGGQSRRRKNGLKIVCVGTTCGQPAYVDKDEWAGGDAICSGDSGGPSLDSSGKVIGVTSRGGENGSQCVGSIYERVDAHKDFIISTAIAAANDGGYTKPSWADPNGGSGGSTQTCDDCQAGAFTSGGTCSSQASACQNNADCNAWITCMNKCSTGTCQAGCFKDHASGALLYGSLDDCICDTACTSECASKCTTPKCGYDLQDAGCNTCLHSKCCAEAETCAGEMACTGLLMCVQSCGSDAACQNKCESSYSTGVTHFNAFMGCLSGKCASECGAGAGGSGGSGGSGGFAGSSQGGTGGSQAGGSGGAPAGGTGGANVAGSGGSSAGGGVNPGGAAGSGQAGTAGTQPSDETSGDSGSCAIAGGAGAPVHSGGVWAMLALGLLGLRRRRRS